MTMGKEVGFGIDGFKKPKIKSNVDTAAQLLLMVLLMRPGDNPVLPHIGIDIKKYVMGIQGDLDSNTLKDEIYNQCNGLFGFLVANDITVFTSNLSDGGDILIIYIPVIVDNDSDTIIYTFNKTSGMDISFKYAIESELNKIE